MTCATTTRLMFWPWRGLVRALVPGALLSVLVLGGCALPHGPTRTTVILLPDEDGNVGAVSVSNAQGTQRLSQAYTGTTVDARTPTPTASLALNRDAVDAKYASLLKAQPPQPVTVTLYFQIDKTALTEESRAAIPVLLEAARARKPTEIVIFGHADSSGTEARNMQLSAERAKIVADLLRKHDPDVGKIELQSFGDKMPALPSRGAEPRNRRAEVMIL